MQYAEKYFVREWADRGWHTISEHETEGEAMAQLDYLVDARHTGPVSMRVIRQTEVAIYTRSQA